MFDVLLAVVAISGSQTNLELNYNDAVKCAAHEHMVRERFGNQNNLTMSEPEYLMETAVIFHGHNAGISDFNIELAVESRIRTMRAAEERAVSQGLPPEHFSSVNDERCMELLEHSRSSGMR
ncbi:hypothetical protein [Brevundimonas subvibrioides]|uniref:hypothetical protein n=1 Tax=Brevundimonas subvibrioides TaxID=74313 RepID=UPI0022B34C65|nr:hypothetical protein [Brevundimonas subvibrioides]